MNTDSRKELVRSTALVIGAWLVVIAAAASERVEAATAVVRINYLIE